MVRHHDQDERETDGVRHWDGVLSVLKEKFRNQLEKEFTDEDWLHCLYLGNIKTRFEISKDENGEIRKFFDPRSLRWNDHVTETDELHHDSLQVEAIYLSRGSSTKSILHCRNWISGRRKEGRQTIFFTLLYPFNSDANEADSITDFKKPIIGDLNKMQCTGFIYPQHKMLV